MSRMPDVPFLGIADNGRMSRHDVVCIHTIVGFQHSGNPAHFTTNANGHIIQVRDTQFASAANYRGNHRVIAIENEDHGPAYGSWNTRDGHAVPAFTDAQCEAIAKICVWAHHEHGIPLALCPDSRPGSRGIAYHRQGIDSNNNFDGYRYKGRVQGGELWSTSTGKVCPGDRRIDQVIHVIIPRARVLAGLDQEEDMTPEQAKMLAEIHAVTKPLIVETGPKDAATGKAPTALLGLNYGMVNLMAMVFYGSNYGFGPSILKRLDQIAGRPPVDVDEAALARAIVPELVELLPPLLGKLSDEELERIADAVADENHRRSAE